MTANIFLIVILSGAVEGPLPVFHCHPERSTRFAKRSSRGVEGPLLGRCASRCLLISRIRT
jgi:hypothetical protein